MDKRVQSCHLVAVSWLYKCGKVERLIMVWSVMVDTWKKISKREIVLGYHFQTRLLVVSANSQGRLTIILKLVIFHFPWYFILLADPAPLAGLVILCYLRQTLQVGHASGSPASWFFFLERTPQPVGHVLFHIASL